MTQDADADAVLTGDRLLAALSALANTHRLRIVARLVRSGRTHVSQLARDVGISRPLLYLHLQRLEAGGLVKGELELSPAEGKALKFFQVAPFDLRLTPESVAQAAETLSVSAIQEQEDIQK
jgi:DNA-binding transcriptional ArsR family regulator